MEYYVVLICMAQMRVLKSEGTVTEEEDELVVVARNTAAQTLPYAVVRLETVIRLYYLRHSFKFCDTYMTYFLSMLVNIVMESKSGKLVAFKEKDSLEHLRSTLVLCLQGLADQGRHAHVTAVICKLLLERQAPEDANMLGGYIPLDILETRSTMDERVYSAYPLQSGMAENPDASRLENLVKKYNLDQEDAAESS